MTEINAKKDSSSGKPNIWPQIILSVVYITGYFIILSMLLLNTVAIPQENQTLANVLIGVLTAAIPMILSYWFGSSVGSKEKTAQMNIR